MTQTYSLYHTDPSDLVTLKEQGWVEENFASLTNLPNYLVVVEDIYAAVDYVAKQQGQPENSFKNFAKIDIEYVQDFLEYVGVDWLQLSGDRVVIDVSNL